MKKAIKKAVKKTVKIIKKVEAKKSDKKITAETVLEEVLGLPGADKILAKHHVPCLTCPMAKFEMQSLTIGDICKMYGIDIKKLLDDLN